VLEIIDIQDAGNNYWKIFPKDFALKDRSLNVFNFIVISSIGRFSHLNIIVFEPAGSVSVSIPVVAPRNNDGRNSCFWCSVSTQKRGGGIYDVCPKCGR
jgi:hypothetical protein